MTYLDQMRQVAQQAIDRNPGNEAVGGSAAALLAALTDNSAVRLFYRASDCADWGSATAGAVDRASYRLFCQQWQENIERAYANLQQALTAAGDTAMAEVVGAAIEQTETMLEQAEIVTDVSVGSLWSNTPGLLKLGALGLGVFVLSRMVR